MSRETRHVPVASGRCGTCRSVLGHFPTTTTILVKSYFYRGDSVETELNVDLTFLIMPRKSVVTFRYLH